MAHVHMDDVSVTVELAWWERPFAGGRARIVVPVGAIVLAECVDRPTTVSATPGGRAGLLVTGVIKVGRWGIGTGSRQFVSARRSVPGLHLVLDAEAAAQLGYDELLVSVPDAAGLAAALPLSR